MKTLHNLPWLEHKKSLTAKARSLGYDVNISLINECWQDDLFRREVMINCNNKASWYGRTSIPVNTYRLRENLFNNLSIKAIGNILFNDPTITIKKRRLFKFNTKNLNFLKQAKLNLTETLLWGRITIFDIEKQPLYLTEVFLPIMQDLEYL